MNSYSQNFYKADQNIVYSVDPSINYIHEYTAGLQIPISLDIAHFSDGTLDYGFEQTSPIPANWGFEILAGSNYSIVDATTIQYTSITPNYSLAVYVRIFDTSTNIDIPNLSFVTLNYKIIGNFTIITQNTNSCTGAYEITVNEHTDGGVIISRPYTVEVYAGGLMVAGYPQTFNTNEISIAGLLDTAPGPDYTFIIYNALGQSKGGTFTVFPPYYPQALVTFAGFECADSASGIIDIQIDGGKTPIEWWITDSANNGVVTSDDTGQFETAGLGISIPNISTGTYTFNFIDANGCGNFVDIEVLVPLPITNDDLINSSVTCRGGSDGSLTFTIAGGWTEPFPGNLFNTSWGPPYTFQLFIDGVLYNPPPGFPIITPSYDLNGDQDGWNAFYDNLPAGSYELIVSEIFATNTNGPTPIEYSCSKSFGPIALLEPDELVFNEIVTDPLCFGDTTGIISISPTGATAPYTVTWYEGNFSDTSNPDTLESGLSILSGPLVINAGGSSEINGLGVGLYSVFITDDNGCVFAMNFELTTPNELLISETHVNIICFGDDSGSITVNIDQESIANYTFTLNGVDYIGNPFNDSQMQTGTSIIFENLLAGNYDITVTDANGCFKTINPIIITQPAALFQIDTATLTHISCNSNNDGAIDIIVSGGTPGYTYTWTGPSGFTANTEDITGLEPGDYTVVIVDSTGICTLTETYTITELPLLTISANLSDYNGYEISCNGTNDGTINVTAGGGSGIYTYNWTTVDGSGLIPTNEDQSDLTAGTYEITITDSTGCFITESYTLSQPDELLISETHLNISCFGDDTGSIEVSIDQTSTPNYKYQISGIDYTGNTYTKSKTRSATTYTFDNLLAGTYDITVTDANGCFKTILTIIITQPASLFQIDSETLTHITCNGFDDGAIDIAVSGGTPAYTYSWIGPNSFTATTEDINSLEPGNYTVEIFDATGVCSVTKSYTITEPDLLVLNSNISNYNGFEISCTGDNNGFIDITVSGGSGVYTYNWTTLNGAGLIASNEDQTNLTTGTYQVTITDSTGCSTDETYILTQPSELLISETHFNVVCYGYDTGYITVNIDQESVADYTYSITGIDYDGNTYNNSQTQSGTSFTFSNLFAGTYDVTVTDANGCFKTISTIIIAQPADSFLIDAATVSNITCNGNNNGDINIEVSGGTPGYTYSWVGPNGFTANTQDITTLEAGDYSVEVFDTTGTCSLTKTYTIIEPDVLALNSNISNFNGYQISCNNENDGSIDTTVTGGTAPYTYNWTTADGSGLIAGNEDQPSLTAGTYNLVITDTNGCSTNNTYTLAEPTELLISETHFNIICFGNASGSITVNIDQVSIPNYTYSITGIDYNGNTYNNSQTQSGTSYTFNSLYAGTYDVTVTDANGCFKTISTIIITQPATSFQIDAATVSNITCNGDNNGDINIEVSGGTPGYSYDWVGPNGFTANTQDITALEAGDYTVVIFDATGTCSLTDTYTISEPDLLTLNNNISNYNGYEISCFNENDGSIDIIINGGVAPYTFNWTTVDGSGFNATSEDQNNLTAGTYNVLITDSTGCSINGIYTLNEPNELLITNTQTNISCFGDASGSILVNINQESTANYTFTITGTDYNGNAYNQSSTQASISYTFNNLLAGIYTIEVADANGCFKTINNINITQPTALFKIDTVTIINTTCSSNNDGAISINVSGGTPVYTYSWTGPSGFTANTKDIASLTPGDYTVTIIDATGTCSLSETYNIIDIDSLALSGVLSNYNGFNVKCNNGDDASINVTVTGGVAPYSYNWTTIDGTGLLSTSEDQSDLTAGTYDLIVTDANGCFISETFIVNEPAALSINEVHTNINCFGEASGSIEVTIDPSVANYTFEISGVDYNGTLYSSTKTQSGTTYIFDNLLAGTYNIIASDANGCLRTINDIEITQPLTGLNPNARVSNYNGFGVSCFNANNANILLSVTGGTPFPTTPFYQIDWTGPNGFTSSSEIITNLEPGQYEVTITDAIGCVNTYQYLIEQPDEILINIDVEQDVLCYGNFDANIIITPSGGTGTYNYIWTKNGSPYSIEEDLINIGPGNYSVIVIDSNGCKNTETFIITQPDLLQINLTSKVDVFCNGEANGSINIDVIGGTPKEISSGVFEYTYNWTGPNGYSSTSQNIDSLLAGEYNLTVNDNLGCEQFITFEIKQPDDLVINATKTDISCYNANDGTIQLDISGGISPYIVDWGAKENVISKDNLTPGNYLISVTDENNCTKFITVEIIEAPIFNINPLVSNITCVGESNGAITLNVVGGVPPINITWTDQNGNEDVDGDKEGDGENETVTNLAPGTYNVTVSDSSPTSCPITQTFTISDPTPLAISATINNATNCNNTNSGTINVHITGGKLPYSYAWDNGISTDTISNLPPGDYNIEVTDANGCQISDVFTITRPPALEIALTTSLYSDCTTMQANQINTVVASGGVAPYTFTWSDGLVSGKNNEIMTYGQNGSYTATVTDAVGCEAQVMFEINISQFGELSFDYASFSLDKYDILSIDDSIQFTNTSTGDFTSVSWDFGDGTPIVFEENPSHTYTEEGTYTIIQTVDYDYGCSYTYAQDITVIKGYNLIIPNGFTPNNDQINDTIRPSYTGMDDVEMSIYDTWGSLIYFEKGTELKGWDGRINGTLAENGNYVIKVKAKVFYGKEITSNSAVTLIK